MQGIKALAGLQKISSYIVITAEDENELIRRHDCR